MPEIGRIQSTNFQSLLNELGIPRANIPFALRSEVTPVVLVGGTVSFLASPTPAYRVQDVFTAGLQIAPADLAVLADTGPLPVGAYSLKFFFMVQEALGTFWDFEWRNAANGANLFVQRFLTALPGTQDFEFRLNIENDNERFRILNIGVGTPATAYQATILART